MGGGVVAFDGDARLFIDLGHHGCGDVVGETVNDVDGEVVLALGVDDLQGVGFAEDEHALVTDLAAHLAVEGRLFEHDLVERLVLLLDAAVTQHLGLGLQEVVAHKFGGAGMELHPVAVLDGGSVAGAFLLGLHVHAEALLIDGHAVLAGNELGEVEREAVGVEQREGLLAVNDGLALGLGVGHDALEALDAAGKGAQEAVLLLLDDLYDELVLGLQLGIGVAHGLVEDGQELVEEGLLLAEVGIGIAHGAAQDATDDVAGLGVAGQLSVGDGEGDSADVVGDDAHGHVGLLVLSVGVSAEGANHLDDGLEDVGVVVRGLALQGAHQALEAHAGVDDVGRKPLKAAVGLAVVLHEDEVPDLDDLRVVLVDELAAGCLCLLGVRAAVVVDLRTGSAGARVAHLPEVVVLVAVQDVVLRQEALPDDGSLVVAVQAFFARTFEDGGI